MDWDDHGMHHFGYSSGVHIAGMFFWFALVALLVWLAFRVIDKQGGKKGSGPDSALAILDRRLAMGEVSAEDYTKAKELLQKKE
ncbi:MAG: hypothetical protein RL414_1176 [Actinomycetota bacterium]|jgi:uncharacterized membrane protein